MEVGDAARDRREVDHVAAARDRRARLLGQTQVAGVHLAALAHPLRHRPLVGDAHLVGGVGEQVPGDGGADHAGAAGDENPAHARSRRRR